MLLCLCVPVVSGFLELEIQVVVSCHVDAEDRIWVFCKKCVYLLAIFPVLRLSFLWYFRLIPVFFLFVFCFLPFFLLTTYIVYMCDKNQEAPPLHFKKTLFYVYGCLFDCMCIFTKCVQYPKAVGRLWTRVIDLAACACWESNLGPRKSNRCS